MLLYHNVVVHTQTTGDCRRLVATIKSEFQGLSVSQFSCVHIFVRVYHFYSEIMDGTLLFMDWFSRTRTELNYFQIYVSLIWRYPAIDCGVLQYCSINHNLKYWNIASNLYWQIAQKRADYELYCSLAILLEFQELNKYINIKLNGDVNITRLSCCDG